MALVKGHPQDVQQRMQEASGKHIAGKREAELTSEEQDVVALFELSSAANVPAATTQQRARTRTRAHRRTEDFATALLRSDDIPSEAGPRYSDSTDQYPLRHTLLAVQTCDDAAALVSPPYQP
ncbi:hypothetical protein PF004_g12498 [Phytophthora fragariae]|uniref:Uncharacterized protein n=1 Tax=Phytophthora fragariae TaxID=53985 RepID=A0A6G0NUY7_9STRA|nr:hypothetical protein PF004_g12498 [Phytophthora fragariae]